MSNDEKMVSVRFPEEYVDELEDEIIQRKADGELPRDFNRSDLIRALVDEWKEGNLSCRRTAPIPTAD